MYYSGPLFFNANTGDAECMFTYGGTWTSDRQDSMSMSYDKIFTDLWLDRLNGCDMIKVIKVALKKAMRKRVTAQRTLIKSMDSRMKFIERGVSC